ncbi:MAG: CBS domain-containing protein [Campylobacteraceae bacterium]|nr:CBS domain-containing protein [Campylobacteraceae bacterium]
MNYSKLVLTDETNLEEAITLLDQNNIFGLPVVDTKNNFIGLITDYDIRKSVLNKVLNLETIINRKPFVLRSSLSKEDIFQILRKNHRRHAPILDENDKLVDFVCLEDAPSRPNKVIIMAGGLGTRLGELTKDTPKPMLTVGNKPMIEHIIDMFIYYGFKEFILSVNYKSEVIKNYFKDGTNFGINIEYIEETKRLGTGGALSLINTNIEDSFFVINGDVLSSVNYLELLNFHILNKSLATMCIIKNNYEIPYGVVESDNENNIINIKEKPVYDFFINAGIYVLNPYVLKKIPKNIFFDLPNLFEILKSEKKVIKTYEISDYWIDMGQPKDYKNLNNKLSRINNEK